MYKKSKKILLISVMFLMPVISFAQKLENPIKESDPRVIIGKAIAGALSVLGAFALAMFIYGGFLWMLSFGNDSKIQKGKDVLFWAFMGLLIIFSSYAIVNYIIDPKNFLSTFFFV